MHQSVGNCFTFYSFADHTRVPGAADREHVITLRTRDKRYLSSNFLVLSTSACECANFFRHVSFPKPFVPLSTAWRALPDRSIDRAKAHVKLRLFICFVYRRDTKPVRRETQKEEQAFTCTLYRQPPAREIP